MEYKNVLVIAFCIFKSVLPAKATIFCDVLKTPDGHLALRAGPSANSKLILKIRTGDLVQVELETKTSWEKVIYHRVTKDPASQTVVEGWVKWRYLSNLCG